MQLQGLHHITMITGDARRNVDFYAGLLGLRMVKKTVNFDQPDAYHLYYGDESGSPGSLLTFFEFAGAAPGRAGAGMIHTIALGVPSTAALDFWGDRLATAGHAFQREERRLRFTDFEGLALELVVADDGNPPLRAEHPEVPSEYALLGVEGARAYAPFDRVTESVYIDVLGFVREAGGDYRCEGEVRHVHWGLDPAPPSHGRQGAGSVHHIAWCSLDVDHLAWQARVREAGGLVTDVRDRDYFKAIYFREPRGVLFEIATVSPGFATDEDAAHLGEGLRVPAMHAHLRGELERRLTPLDNPRARR